MSTSPKLTIENLKAAIEGKEILKGLNLEIKGGEVHAIMGPNGTGKSTLASTLMGHPKYEVTEGSVTLNGEDVLDMAVDERRVPDCFWLCSIRAKSQASPTRIFFAARST